MGYGMHMARVVIIKGTNPLEMTVEALEIVNAQDTIPKDKPVLIKPNYINAKHPSTGITTDSRVIEGIIRFLKQRDFEEIIIGEGSGHSDTLEAFKVAGVDAISDRWDVKTIDLNRDEFIDVHPVDPLALSKVKVAKTALESTLISVPKLKIHSLTGVTLSIKNMMGTMTPKGSMHNDLNKNIADLASVVKPCVAVVDGIIAGEIHETRGKPVNMNLVLAGVDPVAVDTVGATVMGVSPNTVRHLSYASQKGLGMSDLNQIEVIGEPLDRVRKKFRRTFSSRLIGTRDLIREFRLQKYEK